MRPRPEPAAPARVAAAVEALCADVRRGGSSRYAGLLRDNVLDVLRCSFPRFSALVPQSRLERLAAGFMAGHRAGRPQFHHIATEFVAYAQGLDDLPTRWLCLLEYEWTLLAAEIDPGLVPGAATIDPAAAATRHLAANPTLRVVALPFDAERPDAPPGEGRPHVYAVYRSSRHAVLVQRLGLADRLLLDGVQRLGRLDPAAIHAHFPGGDAGGTALRWLAQALGNELVHVDETPNKNLERDAT
jgi:hypothetical protein